jgi:lipopolysaccharide transport system ATP-binding protein
MSDDLIVARGISKSYRRMDTTASRLHAVFSNRRNEDDVFVALSPIDLTVRRGESLGIVGRNGSGKSTLLAVLAGVSTPTTGVVNIHGRVAALLELGSGFDPEFTGRENAYFNGALHGLSRTAMDERFPQIQAFAEIGEFIERPVKSYSSGMFVRLAFAVAVHIDPDILIVDESLSVGDVFFQQKCFERLREMRTRGTTLLFVSHDSGAVFRFCDRAILLEHGKLVFEGSPKDVIETYESALITSRDAADEAYVNSHSSPTKNSVDQLASVEIAETAAMSQQIEHTDEISLQGVEILNEDGQPIHAFVSETNITIIISLHFLQAFDDPHVGFKIRNRFGDVVFETNSYCMRRSIGPVDADASLTVNFAFCAALAPGEYTITLGVADSGYGDGQFHHQLIYRHDIAPFVVLRNMESIQWDGIVNLFPELAISRS